MLSCTLTDTNPLTGLLHASTAPNLEQTECVTPTPNAETEPP
jgi:hypothetical protein